MDMSSAIAIQIPVEPTPAQSEFDMPASVVKSAGRAIQILEFFDLIQREACVSEISSSLKYPQSSTSVLLRSLVAMGYLQHNRFKRTYLPTRRVSLLGNWVDPSMVQHGALLDLAQNISQETGETVAMATINGLNAQYIYVQRQAGDVDGNGAPSIGTTRSLARTAVGMALLSAFDDIHIGKLLRRVNAERRPYEQPIEISIFISELGAGRKRGWFKGAGAMHGDTAIAATVDRNKDGELLVISVEGPDYRMADHVDVISQKIKSALAGFVPSRPIALT